MRTRLIDRRVELGKSQEKLAIDAGTSVRSIKRWEKGEPIRVDGRPRLAQGLQWTVQQLNDAIARDDGLLPENDYKTPSSGLDMLTTLEQTCRQFRTVELAICPGLLQTPSYAHAVEVVLSEVFSLPAAEIAHRVAERMGRQKVLDKANPLQLFALLHPSILERHLGGPEVMADLREHLHKVNQKPNVDIRLLSPEGSLGANLGPFKLITGAGADPFMVVTEDLATGFSYRDGRSVVETHNDVWRHLWSVSDALP